MDLDGSSQKVGGTKPDAVVDTSQFLAYGLASLRQVASANLLGQVSGIIGGAASKLTISQFTCYVLCRYV